MKSCEHLDVRSVRVWALLIFFAVCYPAAFVAAQEMNNDTTSTLELKRKSLEELMQLDIISLSKQEEKLFEAAANVHVITQEDIRRSGAGTLPGALRLAPNLNVAQVDSRQWAISSRGFNGTTSNKLLVLIDGRSVYTPLFSGVFWDVQHVFLEDLDRIEVIGGPGGTLWGANAVNGVINVITKSSGDISSQGLRVTAGAGTNERAIGGIRYGGRFGEDASYRFYGMYADKRGSRLSRGIDASDKWNIAQGGFRVDWESDDQGAMTLQGDIYGGAIDQPVNNDISVRGHNVLGRWRRGLGEQSDLEVKLYIDRAYRRIPGTFKENLNTYDADFQHTFSVGERHALIWGVGFRYTDDQVENSPALAFLPARLPLRLYDGFLQDEITILQNSLHLTLGSKFEHNDFSGFEYQPSVRVSWLLEEQEFLWAAISRAVRTPSRIDRDLYVPGTPPHLFLAGGPNFRSEKLIAYEAGYRFSSKTFTLDVATFYNSYDDLRSLEPGPPPILQNGLEGISYGGVLALNYQLTDSWRLRTGYTYLQKEIRLKSGSKDSNNGQGEGNDPKHALKIYSSIDLSGGFELDAWLRVMGKLPNANAKVPSWTSLDVILGWNITQDLNVSVSGKNLLAKQHPEFGTPATWKEIQRSVSGRIRWTI